METSKDERTANLSAMLVHSFAGWATLIRVFFFNDTAPTEIYTTEDTLSLHDALPISPRAADHPGGVLRRAAAQVAEHHRQPQPLRQPTHLLVENRGQLPRAFGRGRCDRLGDERGLAPGAGTGRGPRRHPPGDAEQPAGDVRPAHRAGLA